MKRTVSICFAVVLILCITSGTAAQPEYKVYFPQVFKYGVPTMAGNWSVIIPSAKTNFVLNPSGEIAGNFTPVGGAGAVRVTSPQLYGLYSYHVTTAANNTGMSLTLGALAAVSHYVTLAVVGAMPPAWDWSLNGAAFHAPTLIQDYGGAGWALYGYNFPAGEAAGSTTLYIEQDGAGAGDFYIDGIQVEPGDQTTFIDGTQGGCVWNGIAHASTSTRDALSRAGGQVTNFDDYNLFVSRMDSTGMTGIQNNIDEYAILAGGHLQSYKPLSRVFTLSATFTGDSLAQVHGYRQDFLNVVKPGAVPETSEGPQPVILRYTGAGVVKEISAHYEGGLELGIPAEMPCWERVAIRFIADDPYFYGIGNRAAVLDTSDSATFSYIAARLRSTGQWSNLGNAGTNDVWALAEDATYIYVGGNFTNWNGIANADYIVRYNKATATWSAMGTGMDSTVYDIVISPTGLVYACGTFTTAGGIAVNAVAVWAGAAWAACGAPAALAGGVNCICFGLNGVLYVGASPVGDQFYSYNGIGWTDLDAGFDNSVSAIAVHPNGDLYLGGSFTTDGAGNPAAYICSYNVTTGIFAPLGAGLDNWCSSIVISVDGLVYAAGGFTTAGSIAANRIAVWNGTTWGALGSGLNNTAYSLAMGTDGTLYMGGIFTSAGGITLTDRVAKWNGSTFAHLDTDLPGAANVYAILASSISVSPVVPNNYDLWLGLNTTDIGYYAGTVTATNNGTERAYPKLYFNRTGGTSATIATARNETIGKELLFDYPLLSGETLTIDLTPTKKSIVSSFFGPRADAVLPNCDFGTFSLKSGTNQVTSFVINVGAATVVAWMTWRDTYFSAD